MSYVYAACVIISIGMLFWLKLFDVRNSATQFINILIVVVSNLGFYFVAVSSSVEEALFAQKIAYVGGIFLPVFYFLLVLEICHISLPKYISIIIMFIQCVLYGFVCSIGHNQLFYKGATVYNKYGILILKKEYGPVHTIYLVTMYLYLLAAVGIAVYCMLKRKSVDKRSVFAMVIYGAVAIACYVTENALGVELELIPFVYILFMIGTMVPVYNSNIYTVYEQQDIIKEQLDKVGFLTFDKQMFYMGCDDTMEKIFPELKTFQLGQKIHNCSPELGNLINQISKLSLSDSSGHMHSEIEPFSFCGKYYVGLIHGVTNPFGKLKGYTIEIKDDTEHHEILTLTEHYNEQLSQEVHEKTKRIRYIQQKTIMGMAQMVESRDLSTGGHIKRTSDVVRIFSNKLKKTNPNFDKRFLNLVIRSAPMHDIGKIGVDDAILRKQGRFTDEEYNIMKSHSEIGYKMVKEILSEVEEADFVTVAENVAHYHHEKYDGNGYPSGLKGEQIPVEARIMALADVFDALVSKRCYKEAFSYDKAFSIIEKDSGTHFDPELSKVFLSCRSELEEYYNENA